MKRKLTWFTVGFTGVLFLLQVVTSSVIVSGLGALSITLILCSALNRHFRKILPLILGMLLAVVWLPVYGILWPQDPHVGSGETVEAVAVASEYSRTAKDETGVWCRCVLETVNGEMPRGRTSVNLFLRGKDLIVGPGDRVEFTGELLPYENTEDFMAFTYYKTRYIDAQAYCVSFRLIPTEVISVRYFPAVFSRAIKEKVDLLFGDVAGLLRALLTGDRDLMTTRQIEDLRVTGMSHVIAVSGMHVAFLVHFIVLIFGKRRAPFAAIPVILCFGLMVGPIPSIVRALFMQCILLIAPIIRRERDGLTAISGALLMILLLNPYAILDVGLQLSFGATLGLILYGERLNQKLMSYLKVQWKPLRAVVQSFVSAFAASVCAMIFTTPIMMITFRAVSVVSTLANVITLWSINFVFVLGIVAVLLSFLHPIVGKIAAIPVVVLGKYFLEVTHLLAQIPYAVIGAENLFLIAFLVYAYLVFLWMTYMKTDRPHAYVVWPVGIIALVVCVVLSVMSEYNRPPVSAAILDVGQGQAVLVETWDETVLVDCGSMDRNAAQIVYDQLMKRSKRKIDALILTHLDQDHANGVVTLLSRLRVNKVYLAKELLTEEKAEEILQAAQENGSQVVPVACADALAFEWVTIELYPVRKGQDSGLAVLVTHDKDNLFVVGDIDHAGEKDLMKRYSLPDVEFFVAGHHGSKSSNSFEFLSVIDPETVLISVGKGNQYGHPSQEVLDRLRAIGAEAMRTDLHDTIFVILE